VELGTVMLAGQTIVGGRAVLTATVKTHDEDLLALSMAVQPIVVRPMGNMLPEVTLQNSDWMPEPSTAESENDTSAPLELMGLMLMGEGQYTVGGAKSFTNT
jgi:hypothetical protein